MIELLNNFPVNWIDGMKINKNHFISMQNNINEQSRDSVATRINPFNYGLLPLNGMDKGFDIQIAMDGHEQITVSINRCHAITPNGARIEIVNKGSENLKFTTSYSSLKSTISNKKEEEGKETIFWINLMIDYNQQEPFGSLDNSENPPRYPYILPTYKIILEKDQESTGYVQAGFQLTIGKIIISNNSSALYDQYIPPSTTINSNQKLMAFYVELSNFLGQLELYTLQIATKINAKKQTNDLAKAVLEFSNKINTYICYNINSLKWMGEDSSPIFILDKIVSLARLMKSFFDSKSGNGKEELFNYFAEWCGVVQHDFELKVLGLINVGYNHKDVEKTIIKAQEFISFVDNLFYSLNRLDYIGKKPESGIYITDNIENEVISKKGTGFSF